jgi:integrase
VENHVVSRIGREKLKNITPPMLDTLFRDLAVSGNREESFRLKDRSVFDGVNRDDFAAKANIDRGTLYKLLRGDTCRRKNAEKVAQGLDLPLEKVFDDVTINRGLSGATVNKIKLNVSAIFTAAVKKEVMRRNPCTLVTPPKVDTPPAAYLDEEQSRILLDAFHNQPNFQLEVIINLLLATGLRAGECTALHWEDIDLQTGLLQVRHTLARYKGQFVRQSPKTAQSERRIILPPYIVSLLTEHKRRQDEVIQTLGKGSPYQGQVFTNLRGDYINGINLNFQFKRVIQGLGLPDVHLHSLRHTHASLLINSDITAKVIAGRLGHANTNTTLNTYSHVFAASEVKAMQAVEMALFNQSE